jgi:hypothetical protein
VTEFSDEDLESLHVLLKKRVERLKFQIIKEPLTVAMQRDFYEVREELDRMRSGSKGISDDSTKSLADHLDNWPQLLAKDEERKRIALEVQRARTAALEAILAKVSQR